MKRTTSYRGLADNQKLANIPINETRSQKPAIELTHGSPR